MKRILLALAYLLVPGLLPACPAAAGEASTLSQHLLALAGRRAGICSMPRCGDGKLAVAMAQNSKLLVHALSEDPAEVAAARKAACAAGLFNRRVYVENGSVAKNPLADWCADLLVIDDASDADMDQIAHKEVRRVLSPYRGVAIMGRAKTRGVGLTRAKLEAWLKGLEVPGGRIVEDEFGLWAVATMPPLAGGDDWTHYAHGPDQNRYSNDDALKYPYLMQWTAKPYYDGKFDIVVAAGGRLFRANVTLAVDNNKPTDGIIARSAYNGHVLWKRKTADDFGTFGSLIVATAEVIYVKDGNRILCLDAETGADRDRFSLSGDPLTECKWLAIEDGIMVSVLGERPKRSLRGLPDDLTRNNGDTKDYGNTPHNFGVHRDWFQDYDQGDVLVAIDVTSGKELWRLPAKGIDPAKTAIAAGHVYFYADRSYAACLDLPTGERIWKTDAPIVKNPKGTGWSFTFMITERVGAVASADVYLINSYKDGHYQAFSAKDGRILWATKMGRGLDPSGLNEGEEHLGFPVLLDGKIFAKGGAFFNPLNGKATGEKLRIPPSAWGGCGSFCVSTHAVHPMCGTNYDRDAKIVISRPVSELKAACLSGVVPADGLLFSGHGNCEGCAEWLGYQTFRSAERISLHNADSAADRLLRGKAVDPPGVVANARDWTTYRADNSRSDSTSATVSGKARASWTWTPDPPFDYRAELVQGLETQSTQAICVGDRVYFGTAEGIVACLDRKSGKELWKYPTAGRIISAPTFWEGTLFVGSGDGRVYCLNARDGSLAWRYRVAPIERRIMVYGHLMSAWPVNANVLVEPSTDGRHGGAVAYASAGLLGSAGGTYLCALDARTGRPQWETCLNEALAVADGAQGTDAVPMQPSATGQMAWYKGNLWLHAGDSGLFIIDPRAGTARKAIDFERLDDLKSMGKDHMRWATYAPDRGQDIGILPGGWVVFGGKQFYHMSDCTGQPRNMVALLRAEADHVPLGVTGYPDLVVLPKANGERSGIPVWDAKETLLLGTRSLRVDPTLCNGLADSLVAAVAAHPFGAAAAAKGYWNEGLRNSIKELAGARQRPVLPEELKRSSFLTPLLAGNAVIFVSGDPGNWHVVAVGRTDAALLWDIRVPAQPAVGGLSMTRAGDVLAPLVDGRVVCISVL